MLSRGIIVCAAGLGHALARAEAEEALALLQRTARISSHSEDSAADAGPLRSRYDNNCADYDFVSGNVYMHPCHNNANQQWYIDNERLKTQHDDKCLDMNLDDNNVYMHKCHSGANQQWYFDGEFLKTRHDTTKCLAYRSATDKNLYMYHACNTVRNRNQQFYWARPANPAYATRVKARHGDKCMDYNYNNDNVYFFTCHDGKNQKFYLDGTDLKSLYSDKCVDYDFNSQNVYMFPCHGNKNQQWYFDGEALKTNQNNKCLDVNLDDNNVYMHNCHAGANQDFYLENVVAGLDHDEVPDEVHQEEIGQRDCKDWCYSKKHKDKAWEGTKCAWKSCAGCEEC